MVAWTGQNYYAKTDSAAQPLLRDENPNPFQWRPVPINAEKAGCDGRPHADEPGSVRFERIQSAFQAGKRCERVVASAGSQSGPSPRGPPASVSCSEGLRRRRVVRNGAPAQSRSNREVRATDRRHRFRLSRRAGYAGQFEFVPANDRGRFVYRGINSHKCAVLQEFFDDIGRRNLRDPAIDTPEALDGFAGFLREHFPRYPSSEFMPDKVIRARYRKDRARGPVVLDLPLRRLRRCARACPGPSACSRGDRPRPLARRRAADILCLCLSACGPCRHGQVDDIVYLTEGGITTIW